jgi:hypothetical protein
MFCVQKPKDLEFGYYSFQKQRLVFAMVGLPARGKTYIARKISRYLNWVGVTTAVFNVGNYRRFVAFIDCYSIFYYYLRERLGANQSNEFFNPENAQGYRQRLHMAIAALDDMLNWLNKGSFHSKLLNEFRKICLLTSQFHFVEGRVAIYDATNTTKERRNMILKRCSQDNIQVVFIESICNDQEIIDKNIQQTKLTSPE